jgi:hypothetical protein
MIPKIEPLDVLKELTESIRKLERLAMEREDQIADLYGGFDRGQDEDAAYENALQIEREDKLHEALSECVAKGVSLQSMRVLAMETGARGFALQESLKGNGDATHG